MRGTIRRLAERRNNGDEGGFTLIELLIVIVILGVLAAIVVFAVQSLQGTSAQGACSSDVQSVDHAVQAYYAENNAWPTTIAQLTTGTNPLLHNTPTNPTHYAISPDPTYNGVVDVQSNWDSTKNSWGTTTLYNPPSGAGVGAGGAVATTATPSLACANVS